MSIEPTCASCGKPLYEFGGILLGPPEKDGRVKKDHLCKPCYDWVEETCTHTQKPVHVDGTQFMVYEHHGRKVAVRSDLKGKHWDYGLCSACGRARLRTDKACKIAQAMYEHCKKFGIVAPIWECPTFTVIL